MALVDILLFEGVVDDAWDAAGDYGCRAQTWLTLARAREESHPLDAIAVGVLRSRRDARTRRPPPLR